MSQWAEACLWTVGCAALGYCAFILADAWIAQTSANRALDRSLHSVEAHMIPAHPALPSGALVGRVEAPRLAMSAAVFESFDASVLNRGVGHLRGSAMPGEPGNVVLAAHRDTFFRPLRNIRPGDEVTLETAGGAKRYQVESTRVVEPDEVSVMNPTRDAELTLITCYPFYFFGHAPERFIVRARAMDASRPAPALVSAAPALVSAAPAPSVPVEPARSVSAAPVTAHRAVARSHKARAAGPATIRVPAVIEDHTPPPAPEAALPVAPAPVRAIAVATTAPAPADAQAEPPAPQPAPEAAPAKHKRSWNPIRLLRKIPHPKY